MKFGASSSAQGPPAAKFGMRTGLPLVPCPKCGEEIMELVCGAGAKVPGAIFFKCSLHERDVPGICPWYLFVEKYEKLLVARGIIQKPGADSITPAVSESISEVEQKTELAPLLDDVVCLKKFSDRVDEKLQKLIVIGKIVAAILVLVGVFVVVAVVIMLLK